MLDLDFNPYSLQLVSKSLKLNKKSSFEELKQIIRDNLDEQIEFYGKQRDFENLKEFSNITYKPKYNFTIKELKNLANKLLDDDFKREVLKYIAQIEDRKIYNIVMMDFCENSKFLSSFLDIDFLNCSNFNIANKCKNFYITNEKQNIELEILQDGKLERKEFKNFNLMKDFICKMSDNSYLTQIKLNKNLKDCANLIYFSLQNSSLKDETLIIDKINCEKDYLFIVVLDNKTDINRYILQVIKEQKNNLNFIFICKDELSFFDESDQIFGFNTKIEDEKIVKILNDLNYAKNISREISDLVTYINDYYFQLESQKTYINRVIINDENLLKDKSDKFELAKKDKIIDFIKQNIIKIQEIKNRIDAQKSAIITTINSQKNIKIQPWIIQIDKDFDEQMNKLFQRVQDEEPSQELVDELNSLNIKYITTIRTQLTKMLNETKDGVYTLSNDIFEDFEKFLNIYNNIEKFN